MSAPIPIDSSSTSPLVGLFVTCLADLFRPNVAFSAVKLLEDSGCQIVVPERQTCCGQPAYNSGDNQSTRDIARQTIDAFDYCDYVVGASGSCVGMIKEHYESLFETDIDYRVKARALSEKSYELMSFLVDVLGIESVNAAYDGKCTYHDSCSGLRELGIKQQPRKLLESVRGLSIDEMRDSDICCGFGGTFCVKYPDISTRMVEDKTANICASEADTLLGGDLGCLMNIAGKLKRDGSSVKVYHVAEILAGRANENDHPPIATAAAIAGSDR